MDNQDISGILEMVLDRVRCIKDDFLELECDNELYESLVGNAHYIDLMLCNADIDILINLILEDLKK